jgi:hypothetical protein
LGLLHEGLVSGVNKEVAKGLSLRLDSDGRVDPGAIGRICTSIHLSKKCLKGLWDLEKLVLRWHMETQDGFQFCKQGTKQDATCEREQAIHIPYHNPYTIMLEKICKAFGECGVCYRW